MNEIKSLTASLDKLELVCKKLQSLIEKNTHSIIILKGDIGAGKTTLVKAYVESLGISSHVTSPTFVLQHCYDGKIYHYDCYNRDLSDLLALGLLDLLEEDGLHFIEWGEGLFRELKEAYSNVYLIDIKRDDKKASYYFKY